jgi:hypothetical protein
MTSETPVPIEELKGALAGTWASVAPEVRPSKNPDGTIKPFFLSRRFVYHPDDRFELTVTNYADPFGKVPLAGIEIGGHMFWRGDHGIAPGAQKVDFVADSAYAVTPLLQGFADALDKLAPAPAYQPWKVGGKQDIFRKSFQPFGLVEGQDFKEYDLVYLAHGLLFWGARNVDGRGFDSEANRPMNLQIPLARVIQP